MGFCMSAGADWALLIKKNARAREEHKACQRLYHAIFWYVFKGKPYAFKTR
jgi:hypothetical protein